MPNTYLEAWAREVVEETANLNAAEEKLRTATLQLEAVQQEQATASAALPNDHNAWNFFAQVNADDMFAHILAQHERGATLESDELENMH